MKLLWKNIISLCLLVILTAWIPFILASETTHRQYKEVEGDQVTIHRFEIKEIPGGFQVSLTSEKENQTIFQTFQLDKSFATLAWSYEAPFKNTKITANRQKEEIIMKGTDQGEPIDKTFDVDNLVWNQTFNIGLEPFALSTEKSMKFWAIGTQGMGNMKITKFKAKRVGTETITLSQPTRQVQVRHMTISLSGILSIFWTGHYYYRQSDGVFLFYRGKNRRGGPVATMEKKAETEAPS